MWCPGGGVSGSGTETNKNNGAKPCKTNRHSETGPKQPENDFNHGSEKIIETAMRRPPHPLGCRHVLLEAESVESSGV